MFCPKDGTHIPLTEEIHGQHPIYDCPGPCKQTWVWDVEQEIYANYPNRAQALVVYEAGEEDISHLTSDTQTMAPVEDEEAEPI